MISFAKAIETIEGECVPLSAVTAPLSSLHGAVLAKTIHASQNHPSSDLAAMDGYAISQDDLTGDDVRYLKILDPIYAGDHRSIVTKSEARPISTGALVPIGTGAILIQERATVIGNQIKISGQLSYGANIRFQGEDIEVGQPAIHEGVRINSGMLGALAAYGITSASVRQKPRVSLITTGNEIANEARDIIDSNGPMIRAFLAEAGAEVILTQAVPDRLDDIAVAIEAAANISDFVVTTGGVSVGAHDLLPRALERIDAAVAFHGVTIKPGKPVLFSMAKNGCPILALPGNPIAAFVTCRFLGGAAVRKMLGMAPEQGRAVQFEMPSINGWTQIRAAIFSPNEPDLRRLHVPALQQSHRLRIFGQCNVWVVRNAHTNQSNLFPISPSYSL